MDVLAAGAASPIAFGLLSFGASFEYSPSSNAALASFVFSEKANDQQIGDPRGRNHRSGRSRTCRCAGLSGAPALEWFRIDATHRIVYHRGMDKLVNTLTFQ
jgi:hypothetical protein